MCQSGPAPIRWWLVPNLLALDAPVVAALWQRFLAAGCGVPVPWAATAALAAAVWCIYLADRWLDARRGSLDADRHHIAARHPRTFAGGFLLAVCLAAAAASRLPLAYLRYGLATGLGIGGYLALAHALAGGLRSFRGAKEFLVAVGFAAGVAVPLEVGGRWAEWLPAVVAFGGLCWLNCRLIDHWESGDPEARWPDGLLWAALVAGSCWLPPAVGLSVAGSALGLAAVHLACCRRPRAARVLADAVLLTPLVWWFAS